MAPALRLLALVCTASALVVRDGGELKADPPGDEIPRVVVVRGLN
tara:strand:- start:55 stop:189 length:135 start_codon:yes stop_codon:yes gene_type:complete